MLRTTVLQVVLCGLIGAGAVGCLPKEPPRHTTYYDGPTLPLDQLLAQINQNNAKVRTLNASGTFLLTIPDETPLNGQLTLLYTKPDQIRILGDKDLAGRIFDLGTDGQKFWMVAKGRASTTWFGTNLGPGESTRQLPIAPQLLADVLGVATLNLDLLAQPIPTLRFNPDYDCYMLTWHQPLKDRWVTLREVWYDRANLEPKRIWLFDRNGRVVVRARLDRFEPMGTKNEGASRARTARGYELFFPETASKFTFELDAVRDERGGRPNGMSYRFNPDSQDTDKLINLDERRNAAEQAVPDPAR